MWRSHVVCTIIFCQLFPSNWRISFIPTGVIFLKELFKWTHRYKKFRWSVWVYIYSDFGYCLRRNAPPHRSHITPCQNERNTVIFHQIELGLDEFSNYWKEELFPDEVFIRQILFLSFWLKITGNFSRYLYFCVMWWNERTRLRLKMGLNEQTRLSLENIIL